jgi:hypothetical protein
MAIQKSVTLKDVHITDCYIKIDNLSLVRSIKEVPIPQTQEEIDVGSPVQFTALPIIAAKVNLHYFASSTATESFFKSYHKFEYDLNGANPLAQTYVYLKTLPEFSGSVDV